MRRTTVAAIVLTGLGLFEGSTPVAAQTRVVAPIIVRVPAPAPGASSLVITTRTLSYRPGQTTTRVTVRDSSGAAQQSVSPIVRPLATVPTGAPSLQVTTQTLTHRPGETITRVTVRDSSGAGQQSVSPIVRPLATVPTGAPSLQVTTRTVLNRPGENITRVTVQGATGAGGAVVLVPATRPTAAVPVGTPTVVVTADPSPESDGSGAAIGTPVTVERLAQTLIITTEAPIDAPIVILTP